MQLISIGENVTDLQMVYKTRDADEAAPAADMAMVKGEEEAARRHCSYSMKVADLST